MLGMLVYGIAAGVGVSIGSKAMDKHLAKKPPKYRCSFCGQPFAASDKFCSSCGDSVSVTPQKSEYNVCECGNENEWSSVYCTKCGEQILED